MTKELEIDAKGDHPYFGWTEEAIKQYIIDKPLAQGDLMMIYNGYGGRHHYQLARVQNTCVGAQKRVVLTKSAWFGGPVFYRTGKNCYAPTGQSRMLPPVSELMQYLKDDVDLWLRRDWSASKA
ncbi:hypothetical protein G4Y73_02785 [Wenzhouxiangella sp. XN201]|uniref:hypothetical protein n=1 Tax=Wenzhouxiangella sp. XN201 TaxID=2710755 RepID=UPI0013CCA76E|nr:hypothetical protein [Wenzhouxiangella sp. XN201]NEZ03073.1 hypothetical protein [Wenzhouxiangella sp. XN201]